MQKKETQTRGQLYRTLFLATFQLSAFTFGGGYVIVPLMRKKFVEGLGWIEEEEMLDLIAIAQSSPGPIAVNASIIIGYRLAGIPGALCAILGTVLPPLIILSVISVVYAAFRDNPVVNLVMRGMQAGVAAILCDVVYTMARTIVRKKQAVPIFVMIAAFLAAACFGVNVMVVILTCGLFGAARQLYDTHKKEGAPR